MSPDDDEWIIDPTPCGCCDGTGSLEGQPCPICGGRGDSTHRKPRGIISKPTRGVLVSPVPEEKDADMGEPR